MKNRVSKLKEFTFVNTKTKEERTISHKHGAYAAYELLQSIPEKEYEDWKIS